MSGVPLVFFALGETWNKGAAGRKWTEVLLTLDVDGHAGLLAVGHGLVGGLADDLLTRLDVGGREVERAHRALPPAIAQERLKETERKSTRVTDEKPGRKRELGVGAEGGGRRRTIK